MGKVEKERKKLKMGQNSKLIPETQMKPWKLKRGYAS